ncbi:Monoacylglycerol lipase [Penicillium ucsense]|uniref:Monoacylglycerol lipase n=1 Tax=Penicillium ucsense TaxID=2839758 RepID=A0A8J8W6Z2_9EURO|nr:Monoacylglycerol lipase [Penicillium ucsense]KAF7737904.1 Monoacylglycerol lipase [Penicillium ucsense]
MVKLQPIFKKAYWALAAGGLVYVLFVTALTFPEVQRFFLYANKVNPAYWQDVNQVEQFGFLKTQVQPFHLVTPDNETLYGWHLMPLHLCYEHEETLMNSPPSGPAEDYSLTNAFKLLAENPNARVVVSFHGNAAHLGSAQRPANYNALLALSTPSHPVHVFAMDYRGFGVSTGTPTEEGLITDGVSLLNFLTAGPLRIPPSRIVIMGQSLGTAVTAAVAERFAFGSPDPKAIQPAIKDPEPFAGVILLASFSNLASLIKSYSVKGLTPPMLSPLIGYPRFQKWVMSHIVDSWDTAGRVARLTGINGTILEDGSSSGHVHKDVDLTIVHAKNDIEIPWREGRRVWTAATGENTGKEHGRVVSAIDTASGSQIEIWENRIASSSQGLEATKKVRWERVQYGGHNKVASFSIAGLAALRSFEE